MWVPALGLLLGLILGVRFAGALPAELSRYNALAILVGLDALFGAARADLEGRYRHRVLLLGLLVSAGLAGGLTWLGEYLGLEFHLAVVVALAARLFHNAAQLCRLLGDEKGVRAGATRVLQSENRGEYNV
jgi:small basic protein